MKQIENGINNILGFIGIALNLIKSKDDTIPLKYLKGIALKPPWKLDFMTGASIYIFKYEPTSQYNFDNSVNSIKDKSQFAYDTSLYVNKEILKRKVTKLSNYLI